MRIFTLITDAKYRSELSDNLKNVQEVESFTVVAVEGHGGIPEHTNANIDDLVVGYIRKIRIDILIKEKHLDAAVKAVANTPGVSGNSIYWVSKPDICGTL